MKTFATLALLGLAATAIKLRQGDDWNENEFEVGDLAYEIAGGIFDDCDHDSDGVCTLDEA